MALGEPDVLPLPEHPAWCTCCDAEQQPGRGRVTIVHESRLLPWDVSLSRCDTLVVASGRVLLDVGPVEIWTAGLPLSPAAAADVLAGLTVALAEVAR